MDLHEIKLDTVLTEKGTWLGTGDAHLNAALAPGRCGFVWPNRMIGVTLSQGQLQVDTVKAQQHPELWKSDQERMNQHLFQLSKRLEEGEIPPVSPFRIVDAGPGTRVTGTLLLHLG
jgi:hypothetical protein